MRLIELGVAGAVAGEPRASAASARAAAPASSASDASGAGAEVRDHLGRARATPSRPQVREVVAVGETEEEPGRVQVAGAGGVDQRSTGIRVDHVHVRRRPTIDRAVRARA